MNLQEYVKIKELLEKSGIQFRTHTTIPQILGRGENNYTITIW